ncbi:MAG: hypothetical protein AMXMBFR34_46050 [Myxococcaceae bacterium]
MPPFPTSPPVRTTGPTGTTCPATYIGVSGFITMGALIGSPGAGMVNAPRAGVLQRRVALTHRGMLAPMAVKVSTEGRLFRAKVLPKSTAYRPKLAV